MTTVDVRGKACPEPVIRARKALEASSDVLVLVDNQTAVANVSRMAQKSGCNVSVEESADGFRIHLLRGEPLETSHAGSARLTVVFISSDELGRGDRQLGILLMRGFFHALNELRPAPDVIILMNSSVKLMIAGSDVLEDLQTFVTNGGEILGCGTCLDHYDLKDKIAVGRISNMYEIVEQLQRADHVVAP